MEELLRALDAFCSPNDQARTEANSFLIKQIENDPNFYTKIFYVYLNSPSNNHKKLSLIIIKCIVSKYFPILVPNIENFSTNLTNLIENTNDINLFHNLSEIVYQIALNINSPWPYVPNCLVLYQKNQIFLPFCLYLYGSIFYNKNLRVIYKDILIPMQLGIIMGCIQFDNSDIRFYTYRLFSSLTLEFETADKFPDEYKRCLEILFQIANQPNTLNENDFDVFWSSILELNYIFAQPFYNIAKNLLFGNFQKLNPHTKSILLQFILYHKELIQKEEVIHLINMYYTIQLEVEDIDQTSMIFSHLQNFDQKLTYQLFKHAITQYLTDPHPKKQYVALFSLFNFFFYYMPESTKDITPFIDIIVRLPIESELIIFAQLNFFSHFFCLTTQLNEQDSTKVFNHFLKIISICQNANMQSSALNCLVNLPQYPSFFDQLISIFPKICSEAIPVYFSSVISIHAEQQVQNNLALPKYDDFLNVVFDIFNKSNEKVNQLKSAPNIGQNIDLQNQLYGFLVLRGSAGNIIFYFSFYNPVKLSESVKHVIDLFVEMIDIEGNLYVNSSAFISDTYSIEQMFAFICQQFRRKSIEMIFPYYDKIVDSSCYEYFQTTFIEALGDQCKLWESVIDDFDDYEDTKDGEIDIGQFLNKAYVNLPSIAKWLYKIPIPSLHEKILNYIKRALGHSICSDQVFERLCKSLFSMMKPRKIIYNKNSEWFMKIVTEITKISIATVRLLLPKVQKVIINSFFGSFVYLMKVFITVNASFGHTFFAQIMSIYPRHKGNTENALMQIFAEMLKHNYCNQQERLVIMQTINDIFNGSSFYTDTSADVFLIFYYLAKSDQNIFGTFLPTATNLFMRTKDEPSRLISKYSFSLFIFAAFAANPVAFSSVQPILPDVFALFPMGQKTIINLFVDELLALVNGKKQVLTKELVEMILAAIIRYLSFQTYAPIILKISDAKHVMIINLFKLLAQNYMQNFPNFDMRSFVASCLPGHSYSIQYILQQLTSQG